MKRKIVYAGAAWGTGLLLASFLHPAFDFIMLPLYVILFMVMKYLFKQKFKEIFLILVVLSISVGFYRIYDMFVYKPVINYSSETVSFSGKIQEFTEYSGDKARYLVKGKINDDVTAKIMVYTDSYNCRINDKFYFEGSLKTPENNYLFSQKDYYKSKGIYLMSDKISEIKIIPDDKFSLVRILSNYRNYVTDFITSYLPEDESALLTGMLFGDKSLISDDDDELFYRTGIGHVMAVSGLHLVLFCGIFAFIFDKMKLGRISRFILLEIVMLLFAVCSGLSLSVMRAALMMTLVYAAPVFFRYSDTLNSLFISLIILTVSCPFSVRNPSLILSLTGAFGAGVFAPYITNRMKNHNFCQRNIKKAAYMFCVSAVIFPVSVMCFGEGSFFSPLANIFLTPICMAALFLALIASLTVFLKPVILIKIAGLLCHIELKAVRFIGQQKFTYMNFDRNAKIISGILLIFCILTYFTFKNYKTEIIAVMSSMVMFCTSVSMLNFIGRNDVKIALLGKNEIDVIVVSHKFSADIIDISGRKDNGRYVYKYLSDSNISNINNIMIKESPYSTMSLYNNNFSLFEVGRIFIPEETCIRRDMKVCGVLPELTHYKNIALKYEEYLINISDTEIKINYGEFSFICDNCKNTGYADVFAEYDNLFEPPECKTLIIPKYENEENKINAVCESNVVIKANSNGKFSVGGL